MTFESDLFDLLKGVTPRVFPEFAPVKTARPYVTYQNIGGDVVNYTGAEIPDHRHAEIQVNVWSDSHPEALALIRAIEDAMRGASAFTAQPMSAPSSTFDADVPVYGTQQDFSCWFAS